MLSVSAKMAFTFDAEILRERDGGLRGLGETIFGAWVDSEDGHDWLIFACIVARVVMISRDQLLNVCDRLSLC